MNTSLRFDYVLIPPSEHQDGYTNEELNNFFDQKADRETFWSWMRGQTGALCQKCGKFLTYPHDVRRYFEQKLLGKPTYWD